MRKISNGNKQADRDFGMNPTDVGDVMQGCQRRKNHSRMNPTDVGNVSSENSHQD